MIYCTRFFLDDGNYEDVISDKEEFSKKRKQELSDNKHTSYFEANGITYVLRSMGGFGISRGFGSIIEIFEGNDKGKLFLADIAGGIKIKGSTLDKVLENANLTIRMIQQNRQNK